MFNQRPTTIADTLSPSFLSLFRAHCHGEGQDFELVCNYCKKSIVFVQTDVRV